MCGNLLQLRAWLYVHTEFIALGCWEQNQKASLGCIAIVAVARMANATWELSMAAIEYVVEYGGYVRAFG
jgi:hypothetical protein